MFWPGLIFIVASTVETVPARLVLVLVLAVFDRLGLTSSDL